MSSIYGDGIFEYKGVTRYYYTFEQYCEANTSADSFPETFAALLSGNANLAKGSKFNEITGNAYCSALLSNYLDPRHWKDVVRISETDLTDGGTKSITEASAEDKKAMFEETDYKLWFTLARTYDKYKALLAMYDAQLATLFDGVSKTTYNAVTDAQTYNVGARTKTSRVNDTPQNGGDWDDDDHTSEITKDSDAAAVDTANNVRTGSLDVSSPAYEKLDKIQNTIKSVYEDWAKEFEKCFYDMGGLD